jgi:hypothetical protein
MIFFARYRTWFICLPRPVSLIALLLVHQMPIPMPSSIDPLVPVLRDITHDHVFTSSKLRFRTGDGFGHIPFACARPGGARADQPMHFWLYRVLQLADPGGRGQFRRHPGNYSRGRFWG